LVRSISDLCPKTLRQHLLVEFVEHNFATFLLICFRHEGNVSLSGALLRFAALFSGAFFGFVGAEFFVSLFKLPSA
jgi:hypothetical protein